MSTTDKLLRKNIAAALREEFYAEVMRARVTKLLQDLFVRERVEYRGLQFVIESDAYWAVLVLVRFPDNDTWRFINIGFHITASNVIDSRRRAKHMRQDGREKKCVSF